MASGVIDIWAGPAEARVGGRPFVRSRLCADSPLLSPPHSRCQSSRCPPRRHRSPVRCRCRWTSSPKESPSGRGSTFYSGSLWDGDIFRGSLRSGDGGVFIDVSGRQALGMKVDEGRHLLFVAGGFTGHGYVYSTRTGATIADLPLGTPGASLVNDVALTRHAAYFTDTFAPVIYKVPISPDGTWADRIHHRDRAGRGVHPRYHRPERDRRTLGRFGTPGEPHAARHPCDRRPRHRRKYAGRYHGWITRRRDRRTGWSWPATPRGSCRTSPTRSPRSSCPPTCPWADWSRRSPIRRSEFRRPPQSMGHGLPS